jgi:hypothetical protein
VTTGAARTSLRAPLAWTAAALVVVLAGVAAWASAGRSRAKAPGGARPDEPGDANAVLHAPRVTAPIPINAETAGKAVWDSETGNTGNLKDAAGHGMVPYTQAKVRWGDGNLYFMLYAGDLDLEGKVTQPDVPLDGDDSFRLELGAGPQVRVLAVSVRGAVYDAICEPRDGAPACDTAWQSGAKVAIDADGTLNKIGDNDEEWVVELALPLSALGIASPAPGTRIPFAVRRCEVGYDGVHACGSWGAGSPRGELLLDP